MDDEDDDDDDIDEKDDEPRHCLDIKYSNLKIVIEASSLIVVCHQQHLENDYNYCHDVIIMKIIMIMMIVMIVILMIVTKTLS